MKNVERTRFDARLTKEQKEFFEYAAKIGGFRSLTEFIINSAQSKAEELVDVHNKIITSKKDQEVFFDYVFKGLKPNKELKTALKEYNKFRS